MMQTNPFPARIKKLSRLTLKNCRAKIDERALFNY
jgi:hypothetical protein